MHDTVAWSCYRYTQYYSSSRTYASAREDADHMGDRCAGRPPSVCGSHRFSRGGGVITPVGHEHEVYALGIGPT